MDVGTAGTGMAGGRRPLETTNRLAGDDGSGFSVLGSGPPSLMQLFEDYFALLPTYKRPGPGFRHHKPVYGYIPEDGSFAQRIRQRYPQTIGADGRVDTHGWNFEEFGLPLNLMLAVPAPLIVGSVRDALARIAADNP